MNFVRYVVRFKSYGRCLCFCFRHQQTGVGKEISCFNAASDIATQATQRLLCPGVRVFEREQLLEQGKLIRESAHTR
jgi:hypothetical protein